MARHWAEVGFGTPVVLHLFYVVKIAAVHPRRLAVRLGHQGYRRVHRRRLWWAEPIVFQKVVLYTLLFEVVGLGCGFGPLNNRLLPAYGLDPVLVAARHHSVCRHGPTGCR